MTYDLSVFGKRALTEPEFTGVVEQISGLRVEGEGRGNALVVRGATSIPCFTVDGPMSVEADDLPENVVAALLDATTLYEVNGDGNETSLRYAVRFARHLAKAIDGAVLDHQLDEVWPRTSKRAAPTPTRRNRIDLVELTWHLPPIDVSYAQLYLDAARRYLPEALPRRFGDYEPLQHRFDAAGDEGFVAAARDARTTLFWVPAKPVLYGSLGGWELWPTLHLSLTAETLAYDAWRKALQRLFLEIATKARADFAYAEVVRNVGWGGRSTWYDDSVETVGSLTFGGREWLGLPPYPVWWSYFGPDYVPLVASEIPAESAQKVGEGLFHWRAEYPAHRDALAAQLPRRGLFRRGRDPWLPQELLAKPLPPEPHRMPLARADRVPHNLTPEARKRA